jgi:hypothetical protein
MPLTWHCPSYLSRFNLQFNATSTVMAKVPRMPEQPIL